MKAVIMAGGKGTRLRPLTLKTPKPMVPLLNRPCMEYIIELLKRYDIHQIAVTVQYLPDVIRSYFGDGSDFGVQLHYFEENTPLGTAGSIKNAASFLDETFIVISGDALTDFNLRQAIQYHKRKHALATMVLTQVRSPLDYGVVMTDEEGKVTRFLEKPSWSEVFSDTVNTGIYVLEPEILSWIPERETYDFSMQLFPALLREDKPLYGYVANGYWSDVGSLHQYRQTQFDMLDRKVEVRIPAAEPMPGLFVEHGVRLPSRLRLSGPSYIGAGCTLHPSSAVGPYTILGAGNVIHSYSSLERTIVWDGSHIGSHCDIQDAIVLHRTLIGNDVHIQEGAVIGHGCALGDKSHIRPQVKLWPDKKIQPHSTVHTSLIWSEEAPAALFGGKGIVGRANGDITPEFAGKLAAAYGSVLPSDAAVVLGSGTHPFDTLLKSVFAAGLRSLGIHVTDIGAASMECTRFAVQTLKADGAVHVQLYAASNDLQAEQVMIQWTDAQGMPIAKGLERKIENAYFQEDFARGAIDRVGRWKGYEHAIPDYIEALRRAGDFELIQDACFSIVVQSSSSEASTTERFAAMLGGTRVHTLSAQPNPAAIIEHVRNIQAQIGVMLNEDGTFQLVTDEGTLIHEDTLLPLIVLALAKSGIHASVGVPVSAPVTVEQVAANSGIRIVRTKEPLRARMEATNGLPFSPFAHRLYAVGLILQLMAAEQRSLRDLVASMPSVHTAKEQVPCALHEKGGIMRELMEWVRRESVQAECLDGVRIQSEEGWILIQPDQDEPLFHIIAQAESPAKARILAHEFAGKLTNTQPLIRK
ncbi:sugar phosphate nucleotidyltransferase [Paenibacillus apiarius]|uniref:sugar phosphate nucleotidyltransferase n=1 Tax=Paenibacillus apiarius TaxID=46240 RepID=UPI003B3A1331